MSKEPYPGPHTGMSDYSPVIFESEGEGGSCVVVLLCCYLSEGVVVTLHTVTRDVVTEIPGLTGHTA